MRSQILRKFWNERPARVALISTHFPSGLVALILGRNETTGLRCMGTCHPMATLKYIDSVTSFPVSIYIYIIMLLSLHAKRPYIFICFYSLRHLSQQDRGHVYICLTVVNI